MQYVKSSRRARSAHSRQSALLALLLGAGGAFAACGTSGGSSFSVGPGGVAGDASFVEPSDGGKQTVILGGGGDGAAVQSTLVITPSAPTLTVVTGQPVPTQQFTAVLGGLPTTGVGWSLDRGELGTIGSTGLFTPSGTLGGVAHVTATTGTLTASTPITVNVQTTQMGDPSWTPTPSDAGAGGYGGVGGNGPGSPPTSGQTTTLNGSPTADTTVSILYPYDGTVWPQGLLAPLLQWNPGAHAFDSVYVHIKENNYEYKGYFGSNALNQPFLDVPIPQDAWSTMAYSNGGEPVTISFVFGQTGTAYGPYTETWTIAQATLQGKIYYNSYGTELVLNSDGLDSYGQEYGAGTLGILPGATAPTLVGGVSSPYVEGSNLNGDGCRVCHTVAANGQTLLNQKDIGSPINYTPTMTLDLANDITGGAGTPLQTSDLTYPALYKDGSMLLAGAGGMIYSGGANGTSGLYALPSGTQLPATGLPPGFQAGLPCFSPDGQHLAFNFWAGTFTTSGSILNADKVSLGILDFDGVSAFSNPRLLYTPPGQTPVIYSSFFPNGAGVVFEIELANPSNDWGYTWDGNQSELWWVDVATSKAHRLDALNGYESDGVTPYLPGSPALEDGGTNHTPALDTTLNYEPTVNPIASGGYAWVVFTSRRMYGNVAQLGPWVSDPRDYPWRDQITDKKLWVAAVDLNGTPGTDTSHPAFYLPAQELHAGNARGYWTVEPCRSSGQSCVTGDQCCGGYCQPAEGGLECTAQAPACSGEYEKCTSTSNCCGAGAGITCVNGVCTQSQPK
jgi:hypothetical protein